MNKYGFPYRGSKNKLAAKIIDFLPKAENFYDLFAGGFAVTHAALENGKYEYYYANDINPLCVNTFNDAINGKFKNETRWISHADFIRLKDIDGYVSICFSFSNKDRSYAYKADIEPYKKAIHYAILKNDTSLLNQYFPGYDFSFLSKHKEIHEKRLALQSYLRNNKIGENTPMKRCIEISEISQNLNRLESLKRLERLKNIGKMQKIDRLETTIASYKDCKIKQDSIIYCDIPYFNTEGYFKQKFDYAEFYEWCSKQKELVFISSYEMPEDFICVKEFEHRTTLSINKKTIEKLFIPKHQVELYNRLRDRKKENYLFPEYFSEAV